VPQHQTLVAQVGDELHPFELHRLGADVVGQLHQVRQLVKVLLGHHGQEGHTNRAASFPMQGQLFESAHDLVEQRSTAGVHGLVTRGRSGRKVDHEVVDAKPAQLFGREATHPIGLDGHRD
jgi:hypothetical protein